MECCGMELRSVKVNLKARFQASPPWCTKLDRSTSACLLWSKSVLFSPFNLAFSDVEPLADLSIRDFKEEGCLDHESSIAGGF